MKLLKICGNIKEILVLYYLLQGGLFMSETGKLGKSAAVVGAGATLLPQTGENMFNFLPILGAVMLVILLGFTIYNKFLKSWHGVK